MNLVSKAETILPIPLDLSVDRTYWWLMGHMLYPDSTQLALGWFASKLINSEFREHDPEFVIDIPLAWLRALAFLPSPEERIKIERRAWKDGMTVGAVISLVFSMHRAGMNEPSLNKAIEILDSGELKNLHRGSKEIRKALRRMAPFAHLWAANSMLLYTDKQPQITPGRDGVNLFLGWASAIREFGITHQTTHGSKSKSLIDRYECVALPSHFPATNLEEISLPLPEWITTRLTAYRAAMKL